MATKNTKATSKPKREWAINTLPLVYDENCKVLILGTFPGPDSRKNGFYYCNKGNRFWKIMSTIFNDVVPSCFYDRRKYLLNHHIALWDICACCTIIGADDDTIRDVTLNHICCLLKHSSINTVFFNGGGIETVKKNNPKTKNECDKCKTALSGITFIELPSSSSSNRWWNRKNKKSGQPYSDRYIKEWEQIAKICK